MADASTRKLVTPLPRASAEHVQRAGPVARPQRGIAVRPVAEQTLYELLEVRCDAPESEIVKAWERAEALYGPDSLTTYTLISPDEAALLGARLEEALNVLLDPAERQRYDVEMGGKLTRRAPCADATGAQARFEREVLPPVIPPLARSRVAKPMDELLPRMVAERAPPVLAIAKIAEPPVDPIEAPAAVEAPAELSCSAGEGAGEDGGASAPTTPAILLCALAVAPTRPIPLATPVHVSPPFAAVAEAPAPAPPHVEPPPHAPRPAKGPAPGEEILVLPEGTRFTGEVLRRAREARGLTVQQMCGRTKIPRHHIENVESDRYDKLPVAVYLRGTLVTMAKELRLDGQKVARSYLEAAGAATVPEKPR